MSNKEELVPNVLTHETKIEGWVLMKGGKFWGETYPGDGKFSASMGWVDEFEKARLSKGREKPPTKVWFTYEGGPGTDEMMKGEWVYFTQTKTMVLHPEVEK